MSLLFEQIIINTAAVAPVDGSVVACISPLCLWLHSYKGGAEKDAKTTATTSRFASLSLVGRWSLVGHSLMLLLLSSYVSRVDFYGKIT